MFLFLPSPHKHPSFSSLLTIQSASSHTIPTPKNSRQNRTINTYNATIIPISCHAESVCRKCNSYFSYAALTFLNYCIEILQHSSFFPAVPLFYLQFQLQVINRIRDCHVPHTFRGSMNRNNARKND